MIVLCVLSSFLLSMFEFLQSEVSGGSCKRGKSKVPKHRHDDSEEEDEDENEENEEAMIIKHLRETHHCVSHKKACLIAENGNHNRLSIFQLKAWAREIVSEHAVFSLQ